MSNILLAADLATLLSIINGKQLPAKNRLPDDTLTFSITIKNTGAMDADEVVQAYIQYPSLDRMPLKELKGFKRMQVRKGLESIATFRIPMKELQKWDMQQKGWRLYSGTYNVLISTSSQDTRLSAFFEVK